MRHPVAASMLLVLLAANACEEDGPRWHYTCGDPVCSGYTVKPGVPLCPGQDVESRCEHEDLTCDPRDGCNRLLVCSVEAPSAAACPDLP
jgi:hypothetical protein